MTDLLNDLAKEMHVANQTWWRDPATGAPLVRNKGELLMLMVSEIAEAMEGERKDLMDDKLPHRQMAEVELADTLIRIFDYAGGHNVNLLGTRHTSLNELADAYSFQRMSDNKGEALLKIVQTIAAAEHDGTLLRRAIELIAIYAHKHGYDLDGAVAEKARLQRAARRSQAGEPSQGWRQAMVSDPFEGRFDPTIGMSDRYSDREIEEYGLALRNRLAWLWWLLGFAPRPKRKKQ